MKTSLSDHTRSLRASSLNITVDLFLLAADKQILQRLFFCILEDTCTWCLQVPCAQK